MSADRRTLLRLAAAALAVPVVSSIAAPARAQGAAFHPPAGPLLYTRTLRREMAGGFSLTVTRSFAIHFVPVGRGFRIEGEQVGVQVDAPAALEAFAQMERERRETGLFPLTLDATGRISGQQQGEGQAAQLDGVLREVTAMLDKRGVAADARGPLDAFVRAVHQSAAGLVTELPADLFAPRQASQTDTREVVLPDGGEGAVTVRFTATSDPATGLVQHAEREVVSDLAGDRRRTLESWTLAPP